MIINQLALVAETGQINCSQLNRVSAALQQQAIRDLRDVWDITATIDAFDTLEDVPLGYWPMIVRDDINMPGAAGVHLDENGQPFALISYNDSWSLTASHEMVEMLVDPWGNRLITAQSQKPDQGTVEFLVEIADPPEAPQFAYTVNGLLVSDFVTPRFYDQTATTGERYSFKGHIESPRTILRGGYISWREPLSGHWWQQIWFNTQGPVFRDLGTLTGHAGSLRSAIDARTGTALRVADVGPRSEGFVQAKSLLATASQVSGSHAEALRLQIDALRAGERAEGVWHNEGQGG